MLVKQLTISSPKISKASVYFKYNIKTNILYRKNVEKSAVKNGTHHVHHKPQHMELPLMKIFKDNRTTNNL